jgi:hypothetical protein
MSCCFLVGCGESSTPKTATSTTQATTSTAVTTTTTTAPPAPQAFGDPTSAAKMIFAEWSGGRASSLSATTAPAEELAKLVALAPLSDAKNRGCDDGELGQATCFFANGQGGVKLYFEQSAAGWTIVAIDAY